MIWKVDVTLIVKSLDEWGSGTKGDVEVSIVVKSFGSVLRFCSGWPDSMLRRGERGIFVGAFDIVDLVVIVREFLGGF